MKRLVLLLVLTGCASTMTPEEREWRRGIDRENWALCRQMLTSFAISDHSHDRKGRRHRPYEIKSDLTKNNCRRVLREYWADY